MSLEYTWLLVICALFTLCECCNRTAFLACVAPAQAYLQRVQAQFYEKEEFLEICRAMEEVNECVKPVIANCPDTVTQIWSGLEDSFNHMCGEEGLTVYLTNLPCFMSEPLKHEMKVCNDSLTRGTEELSYKAHSDTANMRETEHKTCRLINQFVDCMVGTVEKSCNPEAGEWYRELFSKLLSSTLSNIECTLAGSSVRASFFIILIAFVTSRYFSQ